MLPQGRFTQQFTTALPVRGPALSNLIGVGFDGQPQRRQLLCSAVFVTPHAKHDQEYLGMRRLEIS